MQTPRAHLLLYPDCLGISLGAARMHAVNSRATTCPKRRQPVSLMQGEAGKAQPADVPPSYGPHGGSARNPYSLGMGAAPQQQPLPTPQVLTSALNTLEQISSIRQKRARAGSYLTPRAMTCPFFLHFTLTREIPDFWAPRLPDWATHYLAPGQEHTA